MTKEQIIYVRDTIKGDDNLPLRIMMDNMHPNIDETLTGHLIKWDDDNEILIDFRLTGIQSDHSPSNGKYISVVAVPYECIQGIECAFLPIDKTEDRMNSFGIDSTIATNATKAFKQLLRTDLAGFESEDYNRIMGAMFIYNRDEYYSGRMTENFLETRSTALNNKYVDDLKKAAHEANSSSNTDSE